jgi:hypothetical protein
MGNGALPNGPSYRAHPRLYHFRSGASRTMKFVGQSHFIDPPPPPRNGFFPLFMWNSGMPVSYTTADVEDGKIYDVCRTPCR